MATGTGTGRGWRRQDAAAVIFSGIPKDPHFSCIQASNHMTGPDEALAMRARNGDRSALQLLQERHHETAFWFSYRLLGSRADAQDAAQDMGFPYAVITRMEADGSAWFGAKISRSIEVVADRLGKSSEHAMIWDVLQKGYKREFPCS